MNYADDLAITRLQGVDQEKKTILSSASNNALNVDVKSFFKVLEDKVYSVIAQTASDSDELTVEVGGTEYTFDDKNSVSALFTVQQLLSEIERTRDSLMGIKSFTLKDVDMVSKFI